MIIRRDLFEPLGGRRYEAKPSIAAATTKIEPKETPKPQPDQPNGLLLTGIVYLNNEPMALIEDSSRGASYFAKGDRLKDYVVDSIADDKIVLVNGSSRITQVLGSRLYYNASGKILESAASSIQVKEALASSNAPSNKADLSLVEQMRARRKKELGQ